MGVPSSALEPVGVFASIAIRDIYSGQKSPEHERLIPFVDQICEAICGSLRAHVDRQAQRLPAARAMRRRTT
jgi:hypothetical protein